MRYLDYERILTAEEIKSLSSTIGLLSDFLTSVPVPTETGAMEHADWTIAVRGRCHLLESFALLKRFYMRFSGNASLFDPLWPLMLKPLSQSHEQALLDLANMALTVEPFCRHLLCLLTGRRSDKSVYNSFFNPFREQATKHCPATIFPSQAGPMGRYFLYLKEIRNMVGHGKEGLPVESGRLMVMVGYLLLANRFHSELAEHLTEPADYRELDERAVAKDDELRSWAKDYMQQRRELRAEHARGSLMELFKGTLIEGSRITPSNLPRLATTPALSYAPGVTYVIGPDGSGVSSTLLRMIADGTPCPFTAIPSPTHMRTSRFDADWLLSVLCGRELMSLSPRRIAALRAWLSEAMQAGRVAIVFDTGRAPNPSLNVVIGSLKPSDTGLMMVIGATPVPEGEEARFPATEYRLLRMRPLNDNVRSGMLRIFGRLPFGGFDLTPMLKRRVEELGEGIDLGHPRTFVAAVDIVARHLCDTLHSRTQFLEELLRRVGKPAEAYEAIGEHLADRAAMEAMSEQVYRALYHGGGREEALAIIRDAGVFATKESTRRFFELSQSGAGEGNDKCALAGTLGAQAILCDGADTTAAPDAPGSGLDILARDTISLPLVSPADRSGDCVFRPSPRYIAERYALNMLRLHTPATGGEAVLRAAVSMASAPILDELFSPRWVEVIDSCAIHTAAGNVRSAAPADIAMRIADRAARMSLKGQAATSLINLFVHSLRRLNDAQRADLITRLLATADRRKHTALPAELCVNLVLLSFDNPTGASFYDTGVRMPPLNEKLWHGFLNNSDGKPEAWPMMMQVARNGANQRTLFMFSETMRQLIGNGAYRDPQFVRLVDELLDNRFAAGLTAEMLDGVPLADLDPETAIRVYNPTLTDLTLRCPAEAAQSAGAALDVVDGPMVGMLVAPEPENTPKGERPRYSYRLYSYSDGFVRFSTEAFANDNIRGKFLRVDGGVVIGQVACIERKKGGETEAEYAHLTLRMPDGAVKWPQTSTAYVSFGAGRFGKVVPYLAAFPAADKGLPVLRFDDAELLGMLRSEPLSDLSVKVLGRVCEVTDVQIIAPPVDTTFIDIMLRKGTQPDVPPQGFFTLHFCSSESDRHFSKVPYMELPQSLCRTRFDRGPLLMTIGEHDGQLLVASTGTPFARGTLLQRKSTGEAYSVGRSFAIANRNTTPPDILQKADKVLGKHKKTAPKPYDFKTLALLAPLPGCKVPEKMRKSGFIVFGKLEPRWCNAVMEPHRAQDAEETAECFTYPCAWLPLRVLSLGNRHIVDIPYHPAFEAAAHMRLGGVPFTFTARFSGGRFIPDPMLDTLLRDRLEGSRASEPFFVELLDSDMQPITAAFDNIAQLLSLAGNYGRLRPETALMLRAAVRRDPLLLPAAGPALCALGEHAAWLAEMAGADLLTPEICATLPLDIIDRAEGKGRLVRWRAADGTTAPVPAHIAKVILSKLRTS